VSRLTRRVNEIKTSGGKALVAYLVAGDPNKEATVGLMHAMVDSGVDVIELGVPFTDPEAEGPVIQLAHERALKVGTSLRDCLSMVADFRQSDNETPIVLMGYVNPIEKMGYESFASEASKSGVDGTIIVNLPPEESADLALSFETHGLDSVYLLAPTTTDERARFVTSRSRGFVYYVSLKGPTGSSNLDFDDIQDKLSRFKAISPLPIMVGFGIKDASSAAAVAKISDGAVVGSAIVSLMLEHQKDQKIVIEKVSELLRGMRKAIDAV
jgi:tryptophan synthase alpha chain